MGFIVSILKKGSVFTMYDIIGIGVSTVDLLMVVDDFSSQEGVAQAQEVLLQGGGPVATAMVAAARLGSRTAMVDCLGDDWAGKRILGEFQTYGVATDFVEVRKGARSAISSIQVRRADGKRAIIFSPSSADEAEERNISWEEVGRAKIVHMNGRHFQTCLKSCSIAKHGQTMVSFDGGAGRFRPELLELLKSADIIIVSYEFGRVWLQVSDPVQMVKDIVSQGSRVAVVTQGERGCFVQGRGEKGFRQEAFAVPVVDTTGCGDVFHGAFLHVLAEGGDLRSAARMANAAAAIKAQKLGGRGYIPTREEVELFP